MKWWQIALLPLGAFCLAIIFFGACAEIVLRDIYGSFLDYQE